MHASPSSSPLHRSYFSSDASLHTHYFHVKSAVIPSHYLKCRPCSNGIFSSQSLPPGVLILKRPENKSSLKKSRYKWFYERHSLLKCHNFDRYVLHEAENRIILQKEEEAELGMRRSEWMVGEAQRGRRVVTLSNDSSSRFVPKSPGSQDPDARRHSYAKTPTPTPGTPTDATDSPAVDDFTAVWRFIPCDSASATATTEHDHSVNMNAQSSPNDEYYIQYYDGRYLSAKEGKERERLLVLTDDYSELSRWRIQFCERRRIGDLEAKMLQRLALREQQENPQYLSARNSPAEFRVLKHIEMEWFWDIAHKPVTELEKKFDILNLMSLVDEFGFNSLMRAVLRRRHDLVRYFLTRFPRDFTEKLANHRNDTQQSCLHLAAYLGDVVSLQLLLDFGNIPLNAVDKHGHTALMDAVERSSSLAAVQLLCPTAECIRVSSRVKQNVFHLGAISGNSKIFAHLLSFEGREGLCLRRDAAGYTPLHYAVQYGHAGIVQLLLEMQTEDSLNAQTTDTRDTIFHIISTKRNQQMLNFIYASNMGDYVDYVACNGEGVSVREALRRAGLVVEGCVGVVKGAR